jgi:hypothetical protein
VKLNFDSVKRSLEKNKLLAIKLDSQIAPFLTLAKRHYPKLASDAALQKLSNDITIIYKSTSLSQRVSNSPNSIIQQNNQGDNIINQELGEPKFQLEEGESVYANNLYKRKFKLIIDFKVALNNLYLEAQCKSIVDFQAIPQRTGISFNGHSGKRDGLIFKNLQSATGTYELIITSTANDPIKIIYDYQ